MCHARNYEAHKKVFSFRESIKATVYAALGIYSVLSF